MRTTKLLLLFLCLSAFAFGQKVDLATGVKDTLPVANGGSGRTSVCPTGQVMVSNGTGYDCLTPVAAANDLSDITLTTPVITEVLRYNGSVFVNAILSFSDLSGSVGPSQIDQTANYTWTGTHTFGSGTGQVVLGEGTDPGDAALAVGEHEVHFDSTYGRLSSQKKNGSILRYALILSHATDCTAVTNHGTGVALLPGDRCHELDDDTNYTYDGANWDLDGSGGGGGGTAVGANYTQSFTSQTSVVLNHPFGHKNLIVQCFDSSDEEVGGTVTNSGAGPTYYPTVTFTTSTSGYCNVSGGGPQFYTHTVTASSSFTVLASTHGLGTNAVLVACFDNAATPNEFDVDWTRNASGDIAVTTVFAFTGECELRQ